MNLRIKDVLQSRFARISFVPKLDPIREENEDISEMEELKIEFEQVMELFDEMIREFESLVMDSEDLMIQAETLAFIYEDLEEKVEVKMKVKFPKKKKGCFKWKRIWKSVKSVFCCLVR